MLYNPKFSLLKERQNRILKAVALEKSDPTPVDLRICRFCQPR